VVPDVSSTPSQGDVGALLAVSDGHWALSGALSFDSVAAVWPLAERMLAASLPGTTLEIDLAGVRQVDSAGLALLVGWQGRARAEGLTLRYAGVPERLMAIARISEAESFLGG
jgi:phospholipid transport system transporter-binding protein